MSDVNLKAAARGRQAEHELEETGAAFAAVEVALLDKMRSTPIVATAQILSLHASLQALDAVREALMRTVTAGRTAEIYQAAQEAVEDAFPAAGETP